MNHFRKSARSFADGQLICQGVRIYPILRNPAENDGKLVGPPVLNVEQKYFKLPSLTMVNRGRSVPNAQFERLRMRAPPTWPSLTGLNASRVSLPLLDCFPPSNNIRRNPEQKLTSHRRVIRGDKIQHEPFLTRMPPTGPSLTHMGASKMSLPLLGRLPPSRPLQPHPPMSMMRTLSTEHSGKHMGLLVKNSTGFHNGGSEFTFK